MTTGLLCAAAAVAAHAGPRPVFGPGLAPRAPQIMLFFSHSLGGGGPSSGVRPSFGLRLQQVRQGGNSGDPESGDPMQRRELLSWQTDGVSNLHLSNMRVQLGNRVTYDLSNRRFGSPAAPSAMPVDMLAYRSGALGGLGMARVGAGAGLGRPAGAAAREAGSESANTRSVAAAAVAALVSAGSATAQRQIAPRPGSPIRPVTMPRGPGVRAAFNAN